MTPVQLLADQAVAAATCALIPLHAVARAAGDDLEEWVRLQDGLTTFQRQELSRLATLLRVMAEKMEGGE